MMVAAPGVKTAGSPSIAVGGVGKAAILYAATTDADDKNVHAVAVAAYQLDTDHPVFQSGILTTPDDPLQPKDACTGGKCTCTGGNCNGQADFLDGSVGPDGTVWGSFVKNNKLAAGHLWGAPSLWDASDPNGTYR
jgi:hypothetical protein